MPRGTEAAAGVSAGTGKTVMVTVKEEDVTPPIFRLTVAVCNPVKAFAKLFTTVSVRVVGPESMAVPLRGDTVSHVETGVTVTV